MLTRSLNSLGAVVRLDGIVGEERHVLDDGAFVFYHCCYIYFVLIADGEGNF
jgi:hypothetical protein